MARTQPRPQPLSVEHQIQMHDLHREIDTIKNNHLHHMQLSITDLESNLKETKEDINKRFDKVDERIWWLVGLVITTLVTIVITAVIGG